MGSPVFVWVPSNDDFINYKISNFCFDPQIHRLSKGRCASGEAAVSAQRPWKTLISRLTLPKPSSLSGSGCRRRRRKVFSRRLRRYDSQDEGSSEESFTTYYDVPFSTNERLRCIQYNKRRPSFSDTELISDIIKMPVGEF
ncbi:hypothetical protein RUM43_010363 [Polyplax serrata]|uniref:Uncharacterized protein n=1 Tax=Polyplax serrata TaxID=468196 RepID=A0AAN8S773_POLSC